MCCWWSACGRRVVRIWALHWKTFTQFFSVPLLAIFNCASCSRVLDLSYSTAPLQWASFPRLRGEWVPGCVHGGETWLFSTYIITMLHNSLLSLPAASKSWVSLAFFLSISHFFSLLFHPKASSEKSVVIYPYTFWLPKIRLKIITSPILIVPVMLFVNILFSKSLLWFIHMITISLFTLLSVSHSVILSRFNCFLFLFLFFLKDIYCNLFSKIS